MPFLSPGHRFKTTYDFGFVALDILYAYAEDSGTYMCKAKNAVGEAVTTCSVKVEGEFITKVHYLSLIGLLHFVIIIRILTLSQSSAYFVVCCPTVLH